MVSVTESPKARYKIHKSSSAITKNGSKTKSELMSQGQQVMSNIHTVVMVNGSQLGQFLKVLPNIGGKVEREKLPVTEVGVDEKLLILQLFLGFNHCLLYKCCTEQDIISPFPLNQSEVVLPECDLIQ